MAWPITYEFVRKLLDSVGGVAAVVAVWEFLNHLWSNTVTHLPRRAVLGDLAKNDVPCQIFVVHLYTPAGDNKYKVAVPDYFPSQHIETLQG